MKQRTIIATFIFSFVCIQLTAQEVVQESLDWKSLRIRPSVSLSAPLTHEEEIILPMNVNVDGYYELGKVADLRAGLHYGSFKGVSVGGTFHLSDKIVNRASRFIVAETSRRVYFYKGRSDFRTVFGPAADLKIGSYSVSGFYARLDAGFDFQTFSRAYYDGYRSARNGFSSIKIMGTAAKFNQSEIVSLSDNENKSRFGAGGVLRYNYEISPWKTITLFAGGDFGYIAIFGVDDYVDQYVTIENTKSNLILELKLGLTVSL